MMEDPKEVAVNFHSRGTHQVQSMPFANPNLCARQSGSALTILLFDKVNNQYKLVSSMEKGHMTACQCVFFFSVLENPLIWSNVEYISDKSCILFFMLGTWIVCKEPNGDPAT